MLEDHERRIKDLEAKLHQKKEMITDQSYKGLSGGIRFLMNNGFLNEPKAVSQIVTELGREGYHYPSRSVDKLLRVDFTNKRKVLNRIKKDNVWKYVLRK